MANVDLKLIDEALNGSRGEGQMRIAEIGLALVETLLKKNSDYGSSAWLAPIMKPSMSPSDGILVRMSDKINRIRSLLEKPAEVAESLNDSFADLGGYCILWVARPQETEGVKS